MTRKHFEALAITFGQQLRRYEPGSPEWTAIIDTAKAMLPDFAAANRAFYGDRFWQFMLEVAAGARDLDGKKMAA